MSGAMALVTALWESPVRRATSILAIGPRFSTSVKTSMTERVSSEKPGRVRASSSCADVTVSIAFRYVAPPALPPGRLSMAYLISSIKLLAGSGV